MEEKVWAVEPKESGESSLRTTLIESGERPEEDEEEEDDED